LPWRCHAFVLRALREITMPQQLMASQKAAPPSVFALYVLDFVSLAFVFLMNLREHQQLTDAISRTVH